MRLVLMGFMGAGKSFLGKKLALKMNLDFIDLDEYIEEKFKTKISLIFAKLGEDNFRRIENLELKNILSRDNFVLSCGGGTPCFFDNMDIINKLGISVYIKLNEKVLYDRLENSKKIRPLISKLKGLELKEFISDLLSKRESFYLKSKIIVNGFDLSVNDLKAIIEDYIEENHNN